MNREDVLAVIRKHLAATVDGLDPATVLPDRSMKDLGANSLDVVEVVSATMRELKVKVPRADLSRLENIGDLADLIQRVHSESRAGA